MNSLYLSILPRVFSEMTPEMQRKDIKNLLEGIRYFCPLVTKISSRGQPTRGGPLAWGLGEVLTTLPVKPYVK
jgi:hypothetical protein